MYDRTLLLAESQMEPTTIKGYGYQLTYLADWMTENNLQVENLTVIDYRKLLDFKGWGNSASRQNLSALKWYLREKNIGDDDHPILKFSIRKRATKPQRCLTDEQRAVCIEACTGRFAIRDRAIIWFFWQTFVRKFELAGALLEYLDLDNRRAWLETKAIAFRGRGWEEKRFGPETQEALRDWLKVRHTFADPDCKTIFVSNTGKELTPDGVSCIFKRLSKRVGFKVSSHDHRRGGSTHALRKADSRYVMQQGGWKSAEVFLHYTAKAELDAYSEQMWGDDGY